MSSPVTTAQPDTRTQILNLAEQLLLARGYNAFSYQHIARELGIKAAAIHYHYPGKEDLGATIIRRQRGRLRKWRQLPELLALSAAGQLEALFDVYRTHVRQEQRVCLFGSLAAEFRTLPASMQQELRQFNRELTQWLAEVLAAGRDAGQLTFRGEPVAKAAQVLTTLAGALQVARVHDEAQFHLILEQVRGELLEV